VKTGTWTAALGLGVFLAFSASAGDETMRPYLEKGPLVLVEPEKSTGKFGQATAIVLIDAPVEKVWGIVTDFERYQSFVPKVSKSELVKKDKDEVYIHWELDVPLSSEDYVVRYTFNLDKHEVIGSWVKGDLKGTWARFVVDATADGKSLLTHTTSVRNFSSLAQRLEDDGQTITIGVNVSSVLAVTKAIKRRAEGK